MNTYSIYSLATGLFTGRTISVPGHALDVNVPEGCSVMLDHYDKLSQRVDTETGQVIDYVPTPPSNNHQWNEQTRRWDYIETDADIAVRVRRHRDKLLADCDWVSIRAAEKSQAIDAAWASYREALRDISKQSGFPRAVTWPTKPEDQ